MVMDNCGGQEESSEPNDVASQAAPLTVGSIDGGICDGMPDFFRVDVQGPWRVTLDFQHSVGDLDIHVWDEAQDAPETGWPR